MVLLGLYGAQLRYAKCENYGGRKRKSESYNRSMLHISRYIT